MWTRLDTQEFQRLVGWEYRQAPETEDHNTENSMTQFRMHSATKWSGVKKSNVAGNYCVLHLTYTHESDSADGRGNRWLDPSSRYTERSFVQRYFPGNIDDEQMSFPVDFSDISVNVDHDVRIMRSFLFRIFQVVTWNTTQIQNYKTWEKSNKRHSKQAIRFFSTKLGFSWINQEPYICICIYIRLLGSTRIREIFCRKKTPVKLLFRFRLALTFEIPLKIAEKPAREIRFDKLNLTTRNYLLVTSTLQVPAPNFDKQLLSVHLKAPISWHSPLSFHINNQNLRVRTPSENEKYQRKL